MDPIDLAVIRNRLRHARLAGSMLPQCVDDQAAASAAIRHTEVQARHETRLGLCTAAAQPRAQPPTMEEQDRLRSRLLMLTQPGLDSNSRDQQLRKGSHSLKNSSRPASPYGYLGQIVEEMARRE